MWLILFFTLLRPAGARPLDFDDVQGQGPAAADRKAAGPRPLHHLPLDRHRVPAASGCPQGRTAYTDEESRKNFEAASRLVLPGVPLKSRLLTMPLAHEARRHRVPPRRQALGVAERSRMEGARRLGEQAAGRTVHDADRSATTCASATSSATRRRSCSTRATASTSTSRSTSSCAPSASCREFLEGRLDFQLVKQTIEWKAPARFDQVLELSIAAIRLGTTSFTVGTTFRIAGERRRIVTVETVYVLVDAHTLTKLPLPDSLRAALTAWRRRPGHRPRRISLKNPFSPLETAVSL